MFETMLLLEDLCYRILYNVTLHQLHQDV